MAAPVNALSLFPLRQLGPRMMADCVDLKSRYGDRFRIASGELLIADRGENARGNDPCLRLIPCRHGRDWLGASTNRRGPICRALAMLPGVRVLQDGDDGINAIFPVAEFDAVAGVMKPRRRRRLSPEHRIKLVAAGAKNRFVAQDGSGAPHSGQIRDPSPALDSRAA